MHRILLIVRYNYLHYETSLSVLNKLKILHKYLYSVSAWCCLLISQFGFTYFCYKPTLFQEMFDHDIYGAILQPHAMRRDDWMTEWLTATDIIWLSWPKRRTQTAKNEEQAWTCPWENRSFRPSRSQLVLVSFVYSQITRNYHSIWISQIVLKKRQDGGAHGDWWGEEWMASRHLDARWYGWLDRGGGAVELG